MSYTYYTKEIKTASDLSDNEIFVFGSNLAGRHGAGAAKFAKEQLDAEYGIGYGFTGRCYAIPTKDYIINTLSLVDICETVRLFQIHASIRGEYTYYVTKIGCGLAGYKDSDIAPLFKGSPTNCKFHKDWKKYLE